VLANMKKTKGTSVIACLANAKKVVNVPKTIADRNPTYEL
jgi:hypothetical protein